MGPDDKENIDTAGVRIQRRTFPDYLTEDFLEALDLWRDYKEFGYPNGGGSMDQPMLWFKIIKLMSECGRIMKVVD